MNKTKSFLLGRQNVLLLMMPSNFFGSTMKSWMCHKLPWELFVRLKLSCHFMSWIERISFVTRQKHSIVCAVRVHGSNFIYIFYYIFECYLFSASYRITNILFSSSSEIPRRLSLSAFIRSPFYEHGAWVCAVCTVAFCSICLVFWMNAN